MDHEVVTKQGTGYDTTLVRPTQYVVRNKWLSNVVLLGGFGCLSVVVALAQFQITPAVIFAGILVVIAVCAEFITWFSNYRMTEYVALLEIYASECERVARGKAPSEERENW